MSGKSVYKWTAIDRICNSVMTFGGNIMLARMLDPTDFGLIGMVAIFSALASNISGCGMSDGLIKKEKPTTADYSTVFVFNVSMGALFAIVFIACSGLIADYFGHAELKGIMIAIGICFFFQSMALIQETKMRKELDFKKMAIVRLLATASSLVLAVILVVRGYSYWGIVSMQIFLSFFLFVYYVAVSRWFPRIGFYRQSFKEMFGYGVHLMLAYVCYQIARNINMTVLGKYSNAAASGNYNQAHKLQEVPYSLSESILNWPFFAVLSSSSDPQERRMLTGRMHSVIIFVNAVITCYLFTVSAYAFNSLYGSKWDDTIPIFNVLLVFGLMTAIKMFYQTVFKAHAKTKLIRNFTVAEVVMQLALLAVFYKSDAIMIAFTQVIPSAAVMFVYIPLYMRYEGIGFGEFLRESIKPLLIPALIMGVAVAATVTWAPAINCFVALAVVSAIYLALLVGFCEATGPYFYVELRQRVFKSR